MKAVNIVHPYGYPRFPGYRSSTITGLSPINVVNVVNPNRERNSKAASSCSPDSGRGCNPRCPWCRFARASAVVFAVNNRPVQGTRGTYRVNMRHGVSRIQAGSRHTLGIIFHDAT